MADWLDKRLGNFCKSIQDQIDELPFLDPAQKRKFTDMLEECADKADKSSLDSLVFMRREIQPLRRQIQARTRKDIKIG
ncbi:hypothetical protein ACI5KX_14670 [Erythrobacter sp. GH1-10]|uniref:hypothetical protein n=1 Tax=Erythrobacter sp. GH1-10 TaxID=3349334 RepID=UPI0038780C93